jgi:hypothetical protein
VNGRNPGSVLVLILFGACKPSPAPAPAPYAATSEAVYDSLVDAGCLAPSTDGVDAVAIEGAMVNPPAWVSCMFAGGRVGDCEVPCR